MRITQIRQTSPGRMCVTLEDGSEIKTTLAVVTDTRSYSGRELDNDGVESLRAASRRALARERAIELISRRQLSRAELEKKLIDKGESEEDAAYCAAWLEERGLIDDARYAAAVARHYAAKGYGAGRLRAELTRRGIARELWDEAIDAAPPNEEKLDRLIAARLRDANDRDEVRRLSQSLSRRGYSWDEIRDALERRRAEIFDD